MLKNQNVIGLLGGTFDPVHFGHLRLAVEVYQDLGLDHVKLIPCNQPTHKPAALASAEHRLAMLARATERESCIQIDDREITRMGPSYTVETLRSLRMEYEFDRLCLIMGNDAFVQFLSWHEWAEILTLAHIVVAHRPNFSIAPHSTVYQKLNSHFTQNKSELFNVPSGKIYFKRITPLDISATGIREQISQKLDPLFLLPEVVYEYIIENQLYL